MGNTGRTRRPNLTSTHYQGGDGAWHGRVWMGQKPDGTADRRHVQRRTEGEVIKAVRARNPGGIERRLQKMEEEST